MGTGASVSPPARPVGASDDPINLVLSDAQCLCDLWRRPPYVVKCTHSLAKLCAGLFSLVLQLPDPLRSFPRVLKWPFRERHLPRVAIARPAGTDDMGVAPDCQRI